MRKIFEKYQKILWKINTIFGSLEQIFEKFVGNIWLIFLQFKIFSVIRVLTYHNSEEIKKNLQRYLKKFRKMFRKSLRKF